MRKAEREQIRRAIDLLLDDAGRFQEAMMILGKLVGIRFPAFEEMASKEGERVVIWPPPRTGEHARDTQPEER